MSTSAFAYYFGLRIIAPAGKINTRICILWSDRVRSIWYPCANQQTGINCLEENEVKCKSNKNLWEAKRSDLDATFGSLHLKLIHSVFIRHISAFLLLIYTLTRVEIGVKKKVSTEHIPFVQTHIHFMSLSVIGRWTVKHTHTHNTHNTHTYHIIIYYSQAREIREHNKFHLLLCGCTTKFIL